MKEWLTIRRVTNVNNYINRLRGNIMLFPKMQRKNTFDIRDIQS